MADEDVFAHEKMVLDSMRQDVVKHVEVFIMGFGFRFSMVHNGSQFFFLFFRIRILN